MDCNIKCIHHPEYDIIYICTYCNDHKPVCRKCVTTIHKDHSFKDIDQIDEDLQIKINLKYNNNVLPKLDHLLNISNTVLKKSNDKFQDIKTNSIQNKIKINQQFRHLHNKLSIIEKDLINQIDTKYNQEHNKSRHEKLKHQMVTINDIKNKNKNGDQEDDDQNLIEMLNDIYKCSTSKSFILDNINYDDYEVGVEKK